MGSADGSDLKASWNGSIAAWKEKGRTGEPHEAHRGASNGDVYVHVAFRLASDSH